MTLCLSLKRETATTVLYANPLELSIKFGAGQSTLYALRWRWPLSRAARSQVRALHLRQDEPTHSNQGNRSLVYVAMLFSAIERERNAQGARFIWQLTLPFQID